MSETIPTPQRPTELPPEIAAKLEKRKRFPRGRRWLFNIAAALSLVLFVGNYWMWVRGTNGTKDRLVIPPIGRFYGLIECFGGYVKCSLMKSFDYDANGTTKTIVLEGNISMESRYWEPRFESKEEQSELPTALEWFHVQCETSSWFMWSYWRGQIHVPYWFLQLLFAIMPLWWLGRFALRWSEKRNAKAP